MAQRKNHEVDAWLKRPDRDMRIVLLYGPDRGLVSERATRFASATGVELEDPFALVRIDGADVETDPGRLHDEVRTVSMFTPSRLIWIRNAGAGKHLADAIKTFVSEELDGVTILIEAGDLKKGAGLRPIVEAAPLAIALPCYSDDARAVDAVIDEVLGANQLRIDLAARARLKALLGGDRLATRAEIEKLALYCQGRGEISEADVALLIGDVSATSADDAINAALRGDPDGFQQAYRRFRSGGGNPTTLLLTALRQLQSLNAIRGEMQLTGKSASAAVAGAKPPLYFDRKSSAERALSRLSASQWTGLVERVGAAVLDSRRHADLADVMIERSLLALAASGRS